MYRASYDNEYLLLHNADNHRAATVSARSRTRPLFGDSLSILPVASTPEGPFEAPVDSRGGLARVDIGPPTREIPRQTAVARSAVGIAARLPRSAVGIAGPRPVTRSGPCRQSGALGPRTRNRDTMSGPTSAAIRAKQLRRHQPELGRPGGRLGDTGQLAGLEPLRPAVRGDVGPDDLLPPRQQAGRDQSPGPVAIRDQLAAPHRRAATGRGRPGRRRSTAARSGWDGAAA